MKVQQTSEFKRILNADTQNIRITNADGQALRAGRAASCGMLHVLPTSSTPSILPVAQ